MQGIETFCHQPYLFNTTFYKGESVRHPILVDFYKNLDAQSCELATIVHANVLEYAQKKYKGVVNRKVQHKVSQLLLSSTIPSILLELGFLTHPYEKILLQQDSYQDLLAQGIVKGIEEFFESSFA